MMMLDMLVLKNRIDEILHAITKNRAKLIEETAALPQEALEFKHTNQGRISQWRQQAQKDETRWQGSHAYLRLLLG